MEQSWHPESVTVSRKRMELAAVKEYLDEHYTEKLTLDDLAEQFFINKFYLSKIFKETYGTTVNNYLISKRITRAKQLLRFTEMPLVNGIPGFIFEFKHTSDAHVDLGSLAENALQQIDEKKYDTELRDAGINSIIKIGIAFQGKNAVVRRA